MSGFDRNSNTVALQYNEPVTKGGSKVVAYVRDEIASIKQDYKEGGLKQALAGHIERQADTKTLVDTTAIFMTMAVGIFTKDPVAAQIVYGLATRAVMNQGEKLAVKMNR